MPEEIVIEVVHPLLTQLAEARTLARKYKDDASFASFTDELLKKIDGDVQSIKDIFLRLERWERDVKDKIGAIAKVLDVVLVDSSSKDELQSQLQTVNQKISGLKEHMTPPLQLPPGESEIASLSSPIGSSSSTAIKELQQFESNANEAIPGNIMTNVTEQYGHLNHYLKVSLLSFLIFPVDSVIKKRLLFYWWIGEHVITNITSEEDGEKCSSVLIRMGFITPICRQHNPQVIDSCRIHPLIRKALITIVARDIHLNKLQFQMPFDPVSVHPCLSLEIEEFLRNGITFVGIYKYRSRTCFNINNSLLKFEKNKFMEMRRVVVAQIGRWHGSPKHHIEKENTEFLVWLGTFTELRYLSLQGISRITELPPSIGSLTELRILDLRACHNLERLPVEVTRLRNLAHLDASECYLLDHMPKGLDSLSMLEVLKGFVVGSSRSQDACQLGELCILKWLRKLSIKIGRDSVVAEGELNELSKLESLRSLTITWGVAVSPSSHGNPRLSRMLTMTAMNVSPPPHLQKLDPRCFPESRAPEWLSPSKLRNVNRL